MGVMLCDRIFEFTEQDTGVSSDIDTTSTCFQITGLRKWKRLRL